jgi:hypothetical protein
MFSLDFNAVGLIIAMFVVVHVMLSRSEFIVVASVDATYFTYSTLKEHIDHLILYYVSQSMPGL